MLHFFALFLSEIQFFMFRLSVVYVSGLPIARVKIYEKKAEISPTPYYVFLEDIWARNITQFFPCIRRIIDYFHKS